jgi:leukotriene-A4 hydrolase
MENPLLTFYSTALLTETKAVIYEMIHFIALQWTGNLVTMSNWADFWLNEGFATFIERQVSARLYGIDYAKTEALVGNHSLIADMTEFGFASTFTTLHPVFEGKNPEFSRSSVPFEKGFQLLAYIQSLIGYGPMQKFIKYYVENNADKSINSFDM